MSTFEVSTAALLRAIVDSATDYAIVTTDLNGTITSWNTGARNVLGWEAEEVLGRAISLIFTAEDVAAGVAAAERAEAELAGRAFDERWHVRKSGARFWATGELMPLRDGEITGFVKILRDRTTERAAQEDILRSERFKAAVLEGALDCIVTIDIKSRVIEWNTAAEQTFGYARESAIGRDLADLIIPAEFHEAHRAGVARYLTTGTGPLLGRRVEIEGVRADQSRFPIELAVAPIKIDDKQFFTARLRDISDRKSAERALADSEERYRLATEAFQGGVAVHDIRAGTVFRTARQLEIIGETARTFPAISTAWEARIHPEDRPAFLGARRGMLIGDSALFEAEYRICHRDGHWVWIWHRGTAMRDGAGAVTRIISSHIDITERKLAEEALRESQQRLQATYEHASVGIVETDADGRLLRVNQAICSISGYTREELLGDTPFNLTHPDDLAEDLRLYAAQVAGNLPAYTVEKRVLRKDGRPVWTAVSSSAVRSRAGQFLYAVRVTEDIDERRRAEERRALLVNELNHRVKNTLATVQSIATQTLRNAPSLTHARSDLEARLIALSKAHDVLTHENWQGARLQEIVAQCITPYQDRLSDRIQLEGAEIRLSPALSLSLALILHELATNAVKHGAFSNETGKIRIRWSVDRAVHPGRLRLTWTEYGGPRVEPPSRRGFGTKLIDRTFREDTGGKATLSFEVTGLVCSIDAPLS